MKYKVILRRYDSGYIPHSDLILIPIKFSGPPHPRHSWWPSYAYETRRHERALFSCSSYLISAGPYYSYLYLSISACAAEISVSVYYLDNDYEDTRRMPEPLPLSPPTGYTKHITYVYVMRGIIPRSQIKPQAMEVKAVTVMVHPQLLRIFHVINPRLELY